MSDFENAKELLGWDDEITTDGFPMIPDGEYDFTTVAGWIINALEKIPEIGDTFEKDGLRVTVQSITNNRIDDIIIEILETPDEESEKDKKDKED